MNSPPSEDDLQRVAAGESAATRDFVQQFSRPVLKLLRQFHRLTDEDREELAQDTLLTAMTSLERYDRSTKIISWIFGIAKNKALTWLRGEATRLGRPGREGAGDRAMGRDQSGGYETEGDAAGVAVQAVSTARYSSEFLRERTQQARAWMQEQSLEDEIVARHFTHGVPYRQLAEELSEVTGKQITEATARQRGKRFADKVRKRFPEFL
jgi:RNA polymerase sigma factor (sigma-70 family)